MALSFIPIPLLERLDHNESPHGSSPRFRSFSGRSPNADTKANALINYIVDECTLRRLVIGKVVCGQQDLFCCSS